MIKCNACGKDVSENAMSCPMCGEPTPALTRDDIATIKHDARYRTWTWILGLFFFGAIFAMVSKEVQPVECLCVIGLSTFLYIVGEAVRNLTSKCQNKRGGSNER